MGSPSIPVVRFDCAALVPLFDGQGGKPLPIHVNLPPNVSYAKGTILGQVTGSANDVQTVTISGAPTGGTFTVTATTDGQPQTTAAIAYNATAAAVQSALQALTNFGPNLAVTGSAGGPYTVTFNNNLAATPIPPMTAAGSFTGGTSPSVAVAHTTVGQEAETYAQYAAANSNGSQVPKCILEYDASTDANGNVTFGLQAGGGSWGEYFASAPAFFTGTFATEDLVNLDSNAVSAWGAARMLYGTPGSPGGAVHIA